MATMTCVSKVASEIVEFLDKPTAFIASPFSPCSTKGGKPFGFRPFLAHRPTSYRTPCGFAYYINRPKKIVERPDPSNAQEFDRDFYDRFGHNVVDMGNCISNKTIVAENGSVESKGETQAASIDDVKITTTDADATSGSWLEERQRYERELGLPPLPVHLRYINTQVKDFNFNNPAFDLVELMEILRRDKLVNELKAKKVTKA